MNYAALGSRIRYERKAHKWTQARLATEVGLSISYLGHVERGTRKASLETVVAIANCLGVTLDYLLADSLTAEPLPSSYDMLRPKQRRALREIVQIMSDDLDKWGED